MNIVEITRNNFNSWHRHDAEAIAAAYAEGGVYITPSVPEPLTGTEGNITSELPDRVIESA